MQENYGICEIMCFARAYGDYSNWSFGQCLIQCHCHKFSINREKKNTSPTGCHGCNFVTFFTWNYFSPFFLPFLWLHRRIVCNDYNAVYSRLMLFLWSVIECYQYSLWHNINLDLVPVSLNGMLVFWIYIVSTDDKSALVRQMAWYRQATNHYLITWTNVDDASWRHIASLGLNRLTNCGSVTLCNDIGLDKSCLTAPSHYLNQCWPQKIHQPLAITYLRFCSTPWANGLNTH